MSSSTNSNRKFWLYTVVTLAGMSFVAAGFVVPQTTRYAHGQSSRLTAEALQGQGSDAALSYRLAYALDHDNQSAAIGLARTYLANGQSANALELLSKVGDNAAALRLRLQTLIELGRYTEAKPAADKLAASTDESDIILAAALYQLSGNHEAITALDGRLTSIEALQALSRLTASPITEALELRALGLPVSSQAILVKLPPSTVRNLVLAQLLLSKGDDALLSDAANYLSSAIKLDPANVELRSTYAQVLMAQKLTIQSSEQQKLILKLKNGKF